MFWTWLASFLSGPLLGKALDAYKAKLASGNTSENIAADLAAKEIILQQREMELQAQIRIAEVGHPWELEKLFGYITLVYYAKLLVWDKVIGSLMGHGPNHSIFATDGLTSYDAIWGGLVITYYFGKRGFENVARIIRK